MIVYAGQSRRNAGMFIQTNRSIVFQLDSATSLIQAAKNLMNAVVLTVKACYVASTKVGWNTSSLKALNKIVADGILIFAMILQ